MFIAYDLLPSNFLSLFSTDARTKAVPVACAKVLSAMLDPKRPNPLRENGNILSILASTRKPCVWKNAGGF